MPAHLLLVEDDPAIRDGVAVALEDDGYQVTATGCAAEALTRIRRAWPTLAIIDIGLGDGPDGLSLARRLRADGDVPIMFLTARGAIADRLAGFDAGAEDYLVKPFAMAELLARVRVALRRHGLAGSGSWTVGDLHVDEMARTVRVGATGVQVTATEFGLLVALLQHRGKVLSKTQLLASVRGGYDDDATVIESHLSSLRRKLRPAAHELIETVRGYGYVIR
jgi:two-component system OmpR family response regulator